MPRTAAAQKAELEATPNFEQLHKEYDEIREQKRALSKRERELNAQLEDVEQRLIAAIHALGKGVKSVKSNLGNSSIETKALPRITDRAKFGAWVERTKRSHMFEARISRPAFQEYIEAARGHKPPPGVEVYEKETISFRKS